ncbi:MAG: cyclase family protein [Gemmatimonadota bacterium]|nr:cyclase family protein [Gemmatimonadota bacterium]
MSDVLARLVAELEAGTIRVVDLTQPLGPDTVVIDLPPMFAPSNGVTIEQISRYDEAGPGWYWNNLSFGEHTGTHFDAPRHWITGREEEAGTTDTIPVRRFVGPACVIDIEAQVEVDADFLLTPEQLELWEETHGRVPGDAWVLLRTGWSRRSGKEAFLNVGEDGPHSPGFHPDTSYMLAHDRGVLGVGVETVGTDAGQAGAFEPPFPNHAVMHGAGKFGLASLCNLDQLPATGAVVIAAPLKIVDGSGSPLRVIALAPA